MEKLTLQELSERNDWERAVIVFTEDSFDKPYTVQERSYQVDREQKYFKPEAISGSLHGNCLDGLDNGVRLDIYMKLLPEEGLRWEVEYCYIYR